MSPVQPPQPEDVPVEVRDIGLGITIGATAWLIRYFCSTDKHSLGYILRRTLTAGLTSVLVGMATKGYFHSEGIWLAAAGASGYASPELVDLGLAKIRGLRGKTHPKG